MIEDADPFDSVHKLWISALDQWLLNCLWDLQVSKYIDSAFKQSGVNSEQGLNQAQFVDAYKKVVLAVAAFMRNQPMVVAHSDKVFDGTSISNLLKDKHALDLVSIP